MFLSLFIQQLVGFTQISIPVLLLYAYKPEFILSFYGALLCAVLFSLRGGYVYYQSSQNLAKGLQFAPTGKVKDYFEEQIKEAGLNPHDVSLRYAYCDTNVALTVFNTVMIDQMLWHGCDQDPACIESQNVIKTYIQPTLSSASKKLHLKIKEALTLDVQRFIFKHELGHVVDKYSWKKIALNAVVCFCAVYSGIYVGQVLVLAGYGFVSLLGGIVTGSVADVALTWSGNAFFKAPKETEADRFAIKHSSKKEIAAAADFFEKYEEFAREYRNTTGDVSDFAPRFLRGYVPAQDRVALLRSASR